MNRIKEIRKSLGISQRQLAEAAGVSQQQVQRIETGKSKTTFDVTKKICTALGQTRIHDVFPDISAQFETLESKVITQKEADEDPSLIARVLSGDGTRFVPVNYTARLFLIGNRCFEFKLGGRALGELMDALNDWGGKLRFVVFDTPQVRVALNVAHFVSAQFILDEEATKTKPKDLMEISYEKVVVTSPDMNDPLEIDIDPDSKSLDDDFAEDWEVQLQNAFFWAQQAEDENCAVVRLSGQDNVISLVRLDRISMLSVPIELVEPNLFLQNQN